jgi:small subunit ribosomal protein S16
MLSIRLMRTGKSHSPHYRIVVQEKRSKLTGKSVDQIGHYHPADAKKLLVINKDKARSWLAAGAQPSDTVTNLFVKEGLLGKERKVTHFYTPKPKEAVAEKAIETPVVDEKIEESATEAEIESTEEETAPEAAPAEEATSESAPEEAA